MVTQEHASMPYVLQQPFTCKGIRGTTNLFDLVKILKFQLYMLWSVWRKEEKGAFKRKVRVS